MEQNNFILLPSVSTNELDMSNLPEIKVFAGENSQYIAESIAIELSESHEELSYKQICEIINNCIKDMIANAEEHIEGIQYHELYDQFVSFSEKSRNKEKENANE